ncbi:TPA: hypothetical protein HA278_04260, partial [Candidatus Woesearchaeota archaeon]|nr:hypothetical protein [Candidatus Woesearchaeota archaeon]
MEEQKERVEDVYSSEKSTHSEHSAQKEHSHHEKNEDHMRTEHHKEKDHEKKQEHPKQVQPIPLAKIETKTIEVPKENDDTDLIDFSGITKKATTFFSDMKAKLKNKKKGEPTQSHAAREDSESKDTSSFDITTVISFSKKHAKILIPIALILIAILVSTHFRMMSSDLPITDQWAQNTIDTNLQNQLQNQIAQQYPHLPQANREALVRQELDTLYTDNADQ